MSKNINLVSIQPLRGKDDSFEQWFYYEQITQDFLNKNEQLISHSTIISLPEYALGNRSRLDNEATFEELIENIRKFVTNYKINIVLGSIATMENDIWYNRSYIMNYKGKIVGEYDKKKLFNYEKKGNFQGGNKEGIVDLESNNIKIQVLICSDFWYPELIRNNLDKEIDCLVIPAMSVVNKETHINYGRWLWHSLSITRARENVIPVLVSDWAVQSFKNAWSCGGSAIVDPTIRWESDKELKKAFMDIKDGKFGIIFNSIDKLAVEEYRKYRKEVGLLP